MVLQQVESPSDGDKFLRTLYDWNLSAATTALRDAERVQRKPFTPELEAALLALHSEKLFDNVRPTQTRARNFFNQLKGGIGGQIANAGSMSAVFSIVKAISSDVEWFLTWRQLFTNEAAIGERELSLLNSSDPILGWTAANVARRFDLTDADQRQVREIYRTRCFDMSETNEFAVSDTVRWRVVHVLGAFPSAENVELLLGALDSDRYHWTRYGAARSLVEIAARSDSAIRSAVLDGLMTRLGLFARAGIDGRSLLAEIRRAANYEGATGDWAAASSRLVQLISAAEEGLPLDTALST